MNSPLHKTILTAVAALFMYNGGVQAQTISEIAKRDPLIITGSVGTRNTYFHSSAGSSYASPMSNMFYLNLNVSLYGFSMPFSFYYSNNNLDFNYPHINFKINPRYKNWRGYIGRTTLNYSPYIMNMSFNGVGLEYRGKTFHSSVFYGTFRNAINDNPDDPSPRNPQYQRVGWGFNVGYNNARGAIDLYLLRAYDRLNTVDEVWRDRITPQENLSFALKGSYAFRRYFSFSANVAMSAFSTDRRADKVTTSETKRFDKIFDTRYTSLARFAGDVSVNFNSPTFNTSVFYRMVQPDYLTLGTNYLANNYHSLGLTMGTYLFKKVALSATFSGQEDNLTNRQLYTTRGYVYSANASTRFGEHFGNANVHHRERPPGPHRLGLNELVAQQGPQPVCNRRGRLHIAGHRSHLRPRGETLGNRLHSLHQPPEHQGVGNALHQRCGVDHHQPIVPQGEEPQPVGHRVDVLQRGGKAVEEPLGGLRHGGQLLAEEGASVLVHRRHV